MLTADVEVDRRDFTVHASLTVAAGERVALFGPSGAGKTTVLETIAGLVWPRRGLVELGGRVLTSTGSPAVEVPPWQRRVGLLRQDPGLFPHLPVRANLLYARSAAGAELTAIARQLGIDELLPVMPARLSGGQRHRVALGRLLLAHCDALLLDEPFASLDETLRRALTVLVKDLSSERKVPVCPRHPPALGRAGLRGPAARDGPGLRLAGGRARRGGAQARDPPRRGTGRLPRLRARRRGWRGSRLRRSPAGAARPGAPVLARVWSRGCTRTG